MERRCGLFKIVNFARLFRVKNPLTDELAL